VDIESPAEAFAAIAAVVVGEDGVGTDEERDYLLEELSRNDVFSDLDQGAFDELLKVVSDSVWQSLPNDGVRITTVGLGMLIGAVQNVLDEELCVEVCRMATDLAGIDGETPEEHELLILLRTGLGVAEA
jgi:hypothetical protein